MKNFLLSILLVFIALFKVDAQNVVIKDINIVDVENGIIIPKMTVVVKDGIIKSLVKSNKIDLKNYKGKLILGKDKFLSPGLIDMHTHFSNFASKRPAIDSLCKAYLRDGITTVRDAGGDARVFINYKKLLKSNSIIGPTVFYSSFWAGPKYFKLRPDRSAIKGYGKPNAPWELSIFGSSSDKIIEKAVLEAKEWGCTGLKLYYDFTKDELARIIKICKKHGVEAWGHLSPGPALALDAIQAGMILPSHIYLLDEKQTIPMYSNEYGKDLMESKVKNGTPQKRREQIYKEMKKRAVIFDVTLTLSMKNGMEQHVEYMKEVYKAGVKFVAGTDYIDFLDNGKFSCVFLEELETYVNKCGIKPIDAIRAATLNGAEALKQVDKIGVIKEGAQADLLILRENPLKKIEAYRNIYKLIIDGKVVEF